jgi:hypothetical protein
MQMKEKEKKTAGTDKQLETKGWATKRKREQMDGQEKRKICQCQINAGA